jgi:hypothetical protein
MNMTTGLLEGCRNLIRIPALWPDCLSGCLVNKTAPGGRHRGYMV